MTAPDRRALARKVADYVFAGWQARRVRIVQGERHPSSPEYDPRPDIEAAVEYALTASVSTAQVQALVEQWRREHAEMSRAGWGNDELITLGKSQAADDLARLIAEPQTGVEP